MIRNTGKKALALLLSAACSATMLAGCGASTSSTAPKADSTAVSAAEDTTGLPGDISERVELKLFAIANIPSNEELNKQFWDKLNSILLEKLNCTITYEYAEGYDTQGNYELALASGQPYDLMCASTGYNYFSAANRGAYMDLTELMPVYAPELYELISEERWEQAKVNGKIYGIPNLQMQYQSNAFMYREDLRKKYGCEPVTDLATMDAYLQAIKENEPQMLATDDQPGFFFYMAYEGSEKYQRLDGHNMNFVVDPDNPRKVMLGYETPEYLEYLKMAKDWADKGYWSSSVLSSQEWGVNSVINGKAAASFMETFPWYSWHPDYVKQQNPDWEIKFLEWCALGEEPYVVATPATENMMAIAQNAQNPERALMVLNLIQTDEEVWRLCRYGLEGINYELTADGKVDTTKIDPDTERFEYFPLDLIANDNFELVPVDRWAEYDEQYQVILDKARKTDPLSGFAPDFTGSIAAQYNAVNQVRTEYAMPLLCGLTDDVDADYADLMKRLEAAGIEECRAEIERQVNAFLDEKGIA